MDKFGVIQPGRTPDPEDSKKSKDRGKSAAELDNGILRDVADRTQDHLRSRAADPNDHQPTG